MIEDPLTTWPGGFPYRLLAEAGITPDSTRADVEAAAFTLMAEDLMTPATQQAWSRLRDVPTRLLIDLLLYDIDAEAITGGPYEEIAGEPSVPEDPAAVLAPSVLDALIRFDR